MILLNLIHCTYIEFDKKKENNFIDTPIHIHKTL